MQKDVVIYKQAAIDALGEEPYVWTEDDEFARGMRFQWKSDHDAIEALPSAQPEQRWIPVGERLPEEDTDILVTYVDGEEVRIIPVNYARGTWFDCIFDNALDSLKVTAWMPVPESYKGRQP